MLLLQGCASIVGGSSQAVSVDTPGCDGARCELSNDKGKYFVASTPGTVTLSRSYNNLQVTCSRGGAKSDPVSVASTTKGMAFGNILFGGVIGAGVDVSTGAAYDYPQLISVAMQCSTGSGDEAMPALRLGIAVLRVEPAPGSAPDTPTIGAKVVQVEAASLGERWGLRTGDVILRINGNPIRDPDALAAMMSVFAADRRLARDLELLLRRAGDAEDSVHRVQVPAVSQSM